MSEQPQTQTKPPQTDVPRCSTCRWFKAMARPDRINASGGECHRFPKTPIPLLAGPGQLMIQATFPPVNSDDHCGEWMDTTPMIKLSELIGGQPS